MAKTDIDVRRRVVSDLRNYTKYRRELSELLYDLQHSSPPQPDGMPKGIGAISDPTYRAVEETYSNARVKFLTRVCSTIDRCLLYLDQDIEVQRCKERMVELLYFKQGYSMEKVAQEIGYSRAHVYRWSTEIIESVAVEMGYLA